jgi:hypothetical protein
MDSVTHSVSIMNQPLSKPVENDYAQFFSSYPKIPRDVFTVLILGHIGIKKYLTKFLSPWITILLRTKQSLSQLRNYPTTMQPKGFYYHIHNSLLRVPNLRQMNTIIIIMPYHKTVLL